MNENEKRELEDLRQRVAALEQNVANLASKVAPKMQLAQSSRR